MYGNHDTHTYQVLFAMKMGLMEIMTAAADRRQSALALDDEHVRGGRAHAGGGKKGDGRGDDCGRGGGKCGREEEGGGGTRADGDLSEASGAARTEADLVAAGIHMYTHICTSYIFIYTHI